MRPSGLVLLLFVFALSPFFFALLVIIAGGYAFSAVARGMRD